MKNDTSAWFLHTSLGAWDPEGCLISVIDNPAEAVEALAALHTAGFTIEQTRLVLASELLAFIDTLHHRSMPKQVFFFLTNLSDDAQLEAAYRDEARRGHPILIVHAPQREQCDRARELLQGYSAHAVKYYGPLIIRGFD